MEEPGIFIDVLGCGEPIDILPKIKDAVARCKYKHDLSYSEIAALVELASSGARIPSDYYDRVEDRMLGELTGTVIRWVLCERRIAQVTDPDLQFLRPYIELIPGCHICDGARDLCGRWLRPDELKLLPLTDCDTGRCGCQYFTQRRREVERGRRPGDLSPKGES